MDKDVPSIEELDSMIDYIHNQINNEKRPCSGDKGYVSRISYQVQHLSVEQTIRWTLSQCTNFGIHCCLQMTNCYGVVGKRRAKILYK